MGRRNLVLVTSIFLIGLSFALASQILSESEKILAKVENIVITQQDLDDYLAKVASFQQDKTFKPEEKKAHLNNMVKAALISLEAEKEKMDQNPEVKRKLKLYRREILIQEYVTTKIMPFATVTDEEIEAKFKENPNLVPKEMVTLREILVKTEEEAKAIYEELIKGGDFATIAGEKSISQSKIHGGQLRPIARGQLPKALEDVAFSLKKGEYSKPVKSEEGYYILSLVEKKERSPEEIKRLETIVKEKIRDIEKTAKAQEMVEKKVEELKKKARVEVHYDQIQ
jgi:peptidyl-prolyl cis-trans isomerase C